MQGLTVILLLLNSMDTLVGAAAFVCIETVVGLGVKPIEEVSSNSATKDVCIDELGDSTSCADGNSNTESPGEDAE
jgi:hypothetical protein